MRHRHGGLRAGGRGEARGASRARGSVMTRHLPHLWASGTIWVSGSPPAELPFTEPLLETTTSLKVATGVVNNWTADAKSVAESFHRINTASPGRFVLGIAVGHPELNTEQYRKF